MRIRLALTLDIRREPEPGQPERDTTLDTLIETADSQHQAPRIGFGATFEEDA